MEQRATGFVEACDRLTELKLAAELRCAGIRIRGKQIKLRWPTKRRLAREIERAEKHRQAWSEDLDPAVGATKRRLLLALEVVEDPDSDSRIEDAAAMRRRLPKLLGTLAAMDAAYEGTRELREALRSIEALWAHVERHGKNKPYIAAVEAAAARLHRAIGATILAMSGAEYPFDHARGHATLVEVIGIEVPSEHEHPLLLAEVASELMERFFDVYYRVLAELAAIAEAAEASLGLGPLGEEAEARPEESPKQAV